MGPAFFLKVSVYFFVKLTNKLRKFNENIFTTFSQLQNEYQKHYQEESLLFPTK